jgi:hypothetical protein
VVIPQDEKFHIKRPFSTDVFFAITVILEMEKTTAGQIKGVTMSNH